MNQIFHRSLNSIVRFGIFAVLFFVAVGGAVAYEITRSPYVAQITIPIHQPVAFSHKHHVAGVGLDCRYCHSSVETSAFAGMPSTQTCMTCHSGLWNQTPILEPIRQAEKSGEAVAWNRVNDLPDFVYFDHSIHISKGIGCESCHGDVAQMPLMLREKTLQMDWCLGCHRNPELFVRPKEQVFNIYKTDSQAVEGKELVHRYNIRKMTDCSVCHR